MIQADRPLGELLTGRQKFLLLNSLMLTMFVSALDGSIVATAMPKILADLGGFPLLPWVFTAYLLASTVVVPVFGKLSDMFGRKPFIIAGIAIFVSGSAACGLAPTMLLLIVARALQGFGGGILFACVFATLGDLFTPVERAKYMGYFMGAFTIAALSGPTVGGFLTDGPGWRWNFYINLPVGALAAAFIWYNLPYQRKGGRLSTIDFLGAGLLSVATVCLLLALVWGHEEFGWGGNETIGLFVAAAVLGVAFVFQESRHAQAILPLPLFRNRTFVQANLIAVFAGAGMFGAMQYLPTFIQTSLGASATASGLVSTPQSLGLLATSVLGGQVVSRTARFKLPVIIGALTITVAAFFMQTIGVGEAKWHISLYMVLFGLGSGLVMPTMSVVTQSAVSHEFVGVATSARQFFMQIAQVIGIALFGLVFATTYSSAFADGISAETRAAIPRDAFNGFQDPTLALDPRRFGEVRDEVLLLPGGRAILNESLKSQKEAVATAIDRLFLGSTIAGLIVIALAVTLREIPLRNSFGPRVVPEEPLLSLNTVPD